VHHHSTQSRELEYVLRGGTPKVEEVATPFTTYSDPRSTRAGGGTKK